MKTLIIFYSRTGTTKKVAESIAKSIKCNIEEITDNKNRQGKIGYLKCGIESIFKKIIQLNNLKYNPVDYDLVIIGTPIWAANISSPIRTYILKNKNSFKKIAFFCTMGGSGSERAFKEMETLSKTPIAKLELKTREVINNNYESKIKEFIPKIETTAY